MTSCIVPRSRSMPRWGAYPLRSLRTTYARRRTWGHFSVRATPLPLSIWPCAALRPCLPRARYTRRRSEPRSRWRGAVMTRPRSVWPACGYRLLAVEQVAGAVMLDRVEIDPAERYALVFGNEVEGVSQQAVDMCDGAIEIPQAGTKHSLNVSVAGGVVLWPFFAALWPSVR